MGDVLFSVVNLARHLELDPEDALRGTNAKFVRRFKYVETSIRDDGQKLEKVGLDVLEQRWQQAKKRGL
jgi:ATP diphosphatase